MSFDPEAMAMLGARMAQGTPQAAALRLRLVSVGATGAAMAVPWREALGGEPETGVMAGGVITSLLDHVCGLSVSCAVIAANGGFMQFGMATLDLRIDYMRPAQPRREVIALARCYKLTRSIAFVRASAYEDDEADPVATAQAAFAFTGPRTPFEGPATEFPPPAADA